MGTKGHQSPHRINTTFLLTLLRFLSPLPGTPSQVHLRAQAPGEEGGQLAFGGEELGLVRVAQHLCLTATSGLFELYFLFL